MKVFKKRSKANPQKIKAYEKKKSKSDIFDAEITKITKAYKTLDKSAANALTVFADLPLSQATMTALASNNFIRPTDVQRRAIIPGLLGENIVVEAKTGSGKTLAFLIPLMELMVRDKVTPLHSTVAIVMTPTRELARQICLVLGKLSRYHDFSILDIMGGKGKSSSADEWARVANSNVLVGTPGRLAQHQTENPSLSMTNIRLLVMDEADRLLETAFQWQVQAVLDNIPSGTQTLLFSATQTKSVRQLVRLNMKKYTTISIDYAAPSSSFSTTKKSDLKVTPEQLRERYIRVDLSKKLDYLYTFLTSHCRKKIIVFFATQKQVRFFHELFKHLRIYFTLLQLRGNMKQSKRFEVYDKFSRKETGAVLFCTNIAERGLDFPHVDWVVQFDCPHDLNDYVHRVGRTARFESAGRALLFLLPSEMPLIDLLANKKNIPVKETSFPTNRIRSLRDQASCLLAEQPELKTAGQLSLVAYLRDYTLAAGSGHPVFKPDQLPVFEFSKSLGLADIPELPEKLRTHLSLPPPRSIGTEKMSRRLDVDKSDSEDDFFSRKTEEDEKQQSEEDKEEASSDSNSSDDEVQVKGNKKAVSKVHTAKKMLKKGFKSHSKVIFNEEGEAIRREIGGIAVAVESEDAPGKDYDGLDLKVERKRLEEVDQQDKANFRARIREEHRAARIKKKELARSSGALREQKSLDIEESDENEQGSFSESFNNSDDRSSDDDVISHHGIKRSIFTNQNNSDVDSDVCVDDNSSIAKRPRNFKSDHKLSLTNRSSSDDDNDDDSSPSAKRRPNLKSLESLALKLMD